MWPNLQFPADSVTFTEKILNGKLHFLCSVTDTKSVHWKTFLSPEVIHWIEIILTALATNAISEWSFSTLKVVKTSILSSMTGSRLHHLLTVDIYSEKLNKTDLRLIPTATCEWKSPELLLLGCINFEHLFALVQSSLPFNLFFLYKEAATGGVLQKIDS